MTVENSTVEATSPPGSEADEQLQQAVNTTEEASVKDGADDNQEPASTTPGWVQKRFDQMTRQRHEAERKAQAAQEEALVYKRLLEAKNGNADDEPVQPRTPAQDPGSDDDRIQRAAQQLNETQRFNQRANDVYASGVSEFKDFDAALQNLKMLEAPVEFFRDVVELDDPHKIIYALGRNPEEAARILSLPPLQQGRELERLATKAAKPAANKKPPLSNAPEPISSVVDGSASAPVDLSKASIDDFMKARNSQARRR